MIDKATVNKILDTADIVDVVSDFVSLKRRGSNFVGLCPFHDEKTPSFSVSPARQYCHCFGCGKGGSPVGFIMEHEQLSYPEALRYLAKKYNIEIQEKELTSEEREAQTERESMLVLNDFASSFFENCLHNTTDGKEIGLAYFRERGFTVETMRKFHLGYSPDNSTALYHAALDKGYNRKYLFDVGLCIDDNRGGGFDRFRGRVMFPVFNIAGKIIAFGGRTLKNDPAKYFNSPESLIYVKNRELYGLYQAKRAIVKEEKCFLVEGYTDVISMHQAGIENVVASSGTSLTEGQIHAIHRFTNNVTVLYDGDSAGIHASLRGIDMLLAEGLNIKVLLLPDGEDPDSYARSHTAEEFKRFIADNESDFITFKMNILLKDAVNDPIKRAAVIGDVVKSISVIPNELTRTTYIQACSQRLGITEDVLMREMQKNIAHMRDEDFKRRERERRRQEATQGKTAGEATAITSQQVTGTVTPPQPPVITDSGKTETQRRSPVVDKIYLAEKDVAHYIAKYGFCYLCNTAYEDGLHETSVVEFLRNELLADNMMFSDSTFRSIFSEAVDMIPEFYSALELERQRIEDEKEKWFNARVEEISDQMHNMATIEKLERDAKEQIAKRADNELNNWRTTYLERRLLSSPDDDVRNVTNDLVQEKYQISKIHTQYGNIETEFDRLSTFVPMALTIWKMALVDKEIEGIHFQLKTAVGDRAIQLLQQLQAFNDLRRQLAKISGERVITP